MSGIVIDTNILSFLFKNDTRARDYEKHLLSGPIFIAFVTVAEVERWALERNWGPRLRERLNEHLKNYIVYPFHRSLCTRWAEVCVSARRAGKPVGVHDAWIAATALELAMPLVTHDRYGFLGVDGLNMISEAPL
jgi:tRNA(fMet)-specific endonuclease VapC